MTTKSKQNYTAPRPFYGKKTDTYELADSTPYGDKTEAKTSVWLDRVNPKFMGFRKVTAEQRATMLASQGVSDQEIRQTISKVYNQDVKSINWQYTGE